MPGSLPRPPVAVVLTAEHPTLAPGAQRLRAAQWQQWMEAGEALRAAQRTARAIVGRAEADREEARQQGLRQGREEARSELLKATAEMRGTLGRWVRETEPRLVDLVLRCVREVVRGVDPSQLVRGSVDRALTEMTRAADVRIQVHESQVAEIREALASLAQQHDIRGVVRVEAAMSLQPGDCIVESPLGLVDLRVASQLRFVEQAVHPQ